MPAPIVTRPRATVAAPPPTTHPSIDWANYARYLLIAALVIMAAMVQPMRKLSR